MLGELHVDYGVGWALVATGGVDLAVKEDKLPVRFRWRGEADLRAEGSVTGTFRLDPAPRADGCRLYLWNPFAEHEDGDGSNYIGRLSYGRCFLKLSVAGRIIPVEADVRPSVMSEEQILAMRTSIASVASELLRCGRDARTRTETGTRRRRPREWRELQAQIIVAAKDVIGDIRRVAARPLSRLVPSRPQAPRRPAADDRAIDLYENHLIAMIVRRWADDLAACARTASDEARDTAALAASLVQRASAPMPEKWVAARAADVRAYREQAELAKAFERYLRGALGQLATLRCGSVEPHLTPGIARSPSYLRIFRAWSAIRHEELAAPHRLATLPDRRVSLLFQDWALFTMAHLLDRLGWQMDDADWLAPAGAGRYALAVRRDHPWTWRKDQEVLRIWSEPTLARAARGARGRTKRERAMRALAEVGRAEGLYTHEAAVNPDFVLHWRHADGRHALVVGDARYAPLLDSDDANRDDATRMRREGVMEKYRTVRDRYAPAAWLQLGGGSCVEAIDDCGLVVFPGPADAAGWFDADDALLLPLRPAQDGGGVAEVERATAQWEALLDRMREASAEPWTP